MLKEDGRATLRPRGHSRQGGRPSAEARQAILAEVATLYWIDKLNQEQIGRQIGRSVPTVSRLLTEADVAGIVEVRIRYPVAIVPELQSELTDRFGLRVARVLAAAAADPARLLTQLGELAARYLTTVLGDGMTVSVGWGTTLYEVVQALRPMHYRDVRVAQALGSLGSKLPAIDNHLIARTLADRVGGTPHFLPAPMIVESELVREALLQDHQVRETLEIGRHSDISLTGIGVAEPDLAGMYRAGYIDEATLDGIRAAGAVGDILVGFFDRAGNRLDMPVTRRVIGLSLDDLAAIPMSIGVAGGTRKAAAILGALRAGLLHVLVTDEATARDVLRLDSE
ncbi:MAG: sugar-binding transcriptional regulator [Chloroflexia bacterium]|nr:sugar-binding transcriptional regulator [Chloroflexia bacterium]